MTPPNRWDLNCETEGMKFGAVRDGNSLSALMIARDDHNGAESPAPKFRHHLQKEAKNHHKIQMVAEPHGMIHNHPSGDPTPSAADVDMTRQVTDALRPLRIAVHDHLIAGRDGVASLKALGLM